MQTAVTNNKMQAVVKRITADAIELSNGATVNVADVRLPTRPLSDQPVLKVGDSLRRTGAQWSLMENK